jgi:sugar phosphate isomerase/epimerase
MMEQRLGASTCWRAADFEDGEELLAAMEQLPLSALELEYRITGPMYLRMKPHLRKDYFRVLSIHNFFPLPPGVPRSKASGDLYNPASSDRDERALAVRHLVGTLETANDLEVDRVVVHGGFIEGLEEDMKELREVRSSGLSDGRLEEVRDRLLRKRETNADGFLDRLLKSIDECIRSAERLGVTLCMENRADPYQLPDLGEMRKLFETFDGGPVGLWLDLGHTVRQERLGLCDVADWMEFPMELLQGIHVHDCKGFSDHRPPGEGDADLTRFRPVLTRSPVLIFEIEKSFERSRVIDSISYFKNEILRP